MQHTPGPWYDHGKYVDAMVNDDDAETVADDIRTLADARLIAAAPDLLAAAEEVVDELVHMLRKGDGATGLDYAYEKLVKAIGKAEGE